MEKNSSWSKVIPFIPIGMGVLQHEWIDLYEDYTSTDLPIPSPPKSIQINFYARSSK